MRRQRKGGFMERGRTFWELVQEEKKKLMKEEILESAFYKETLL